jgi:hypothetical protein
MKIRLTALQWTGLVLIVVATSFIPLLAVVPFLQLTLKQKAVLTSFLVIGGQVMTWVGGILLGKELVVRYRQYLNPKRWFRKK